MHRGDVDQRAAGFRPSVVAGEFAERPFRLHRIGADDAFDHQFRIGREQQIGRLAAHDRDRLALDAAGVFVFGHVLGKRLRADQHEQRIDAPGGGDVDRLALLPGAGDVQARVLAGRQIEPDLRLALHHHPVGADVEIAAVGIAGDHRVARCRRSGRRRAASGAESAADRGRSSCR